MVELKKNIETEKKLEEDWKKGIVTELPSGKIITYVTLKQRDVEDADDLVINDPKNSADIFVTYLIERFLDKNKHHSWESLDSEDQAFIYALLIEDLDLTNEVKNSKGITIQVKIYSAYIESHELLLQNVTVGLEWLWNLDESLDNAALLRSTFPEIESAKRLADLQSQLAIDAAKTFEFTQQIFEEVKIAQFYNNGLAESVNLMQDISKGIGDNLIPSLDLGSSLEDHFGFLDEQRNHIANMISASACAMTQVLQEKFPTISKIGENSQGIFTFDDISRYSDYSLTTPDTLEVEEQLDRLHERNSSVLFKELRKILSFVDQSFVDKLDGAWMSLNSSNPEKVRHCSVSIRELIREVLHKLAPDEKISEWTSNPDCFYENKPTKSTRIKYILRDVDSKSTIKYLKSMGILLIDKNSRSTHESNTDISDIELRREFQISICWLGQLVDLWKNHR